MNIFAEHETRYILNQCKVDVSGELFEGYYMETDCIDDRVVLVDKKKRPKNLLIPSNVKDQNGWIME